MRFPDFNDDWTQTTLGEIASFFSGGTPSTTKKEFYEGDIPFIRSGEIHSKNTEIKISKSALYNSSAKLVEVEDILLALYGATSGDIAISQIRGAINQAILCIRPYCDFNKHYVFYHWQRNYSRVVKKYLQGGQGNLSAEVVKSVLFRYPSLTEQKKIADFLSLIDERIQSCSETIKELKTQKAGLLNQLFSQKLRFPDFTDDWKETTLGEICTIKTGKLDANAMVEKGRYPFFTCSKDVYKTDSYAFDGEAILIAGNGDIGLSKFYIGKFNAYQRTYVLQDFKKIASLFLKHQIDCFLPNRAQVYKNNGAMPYITLGVLLEMPISLASLAEQKKIADFLSLIDERIEVEEQLLQQYEKQKRYLLKQMFV